MSIQYFKSPFGEAFAKGGQMLGEGLAERGKKQQQSKLGETLQNAINEATVDPATGEKKPVDLESTLNLIAKISKVPGGMKELAPYLQLVAPVLKEQTKMTGLNDLLNQVNSQNPDGSFSKNDTLNIEADEDITGSSQSRNISDDFILRVSAINPTAGRILQDQKNASKKEDLQFQKGSFERNKKYLEKLDEFDANAAKQEIALNQMGAALEGKDFNAYRNIVADFTGLDFIRNSSSQIVNSANKEFLVATLSELTGRPNQFIEQQLLKALLNPQYTQETNELIYKGLKGVFDLKRSERNAALNIEEDYAKKGKEVPRNLQSIVKKQMKPEIDGFMEQYNSDLKSLSQKIENKNTRFKKVAKGTELPRSEYEKIRAGVTTKEKAIELARSLGYDI